LAVHVICIGIYLNVPRYTAEVAPGNEGYYCHLSKVSKGLVEEVRFCPAYRYQLVQTILHQIS